MQVGQCHVKLFGKQVNIPQISILLFFTVVIIHSKCISWYFLKHLPIIRLYKNLIIKFSLVFIDCILCAI